MQSGTPIWIGILVAIVLAAYLARYEVVPATVSVVYRLDRWTGQIQFCVLQELKVQCK
jgi:hypothetical protein